MANAEADKHVSGRLPVSKRIGFWLGLALFVLVLILPAPPSMRVAVQDQFGEEMRSEVAHELAQSGHAEVTPESATFSAALENKIDDRARVMMAAAAVTALVAIWWITVAAPIPVTSLLPLALFPLLGVLHISEAARPYSNHNIFLFMGGFIIALGIERWGLHRRIALHIVRLVGTSRPTIVLGFMLASAFLSMWISNTATVLMMLPIGLAIIAAVREMAEGLEERDHQNFAAALMLGIAYAASIGGVGTPIGTPPNIAFRGQFAKLFPGAPEISFGQWILVFLPLVVLFLPIVWLILVKVTCRVRVARVPVGREVIREDLRKLGPMRRPEKGVLVVFALTALLWMTRSIPIGHANYGWASLLEWLLSREHGASALFHANYINDASVAIFTAVLLFIIPAHGSAERRAGQHEYLMDWETAQRLPWGILILFGGGFAIAAGFQSSGLSYWCGQVFAGIGLVNPVAVVLCTCLLMTFLTEITSNTATTQVMLPILARVATAMGVHPLLLMLPATVSASCAFMLPVATPPNAIIFGSGCVSMGRMVRTGIILNLIGVVLVTGVFYLTACPLLGINVNTLPTWAH